MSVTKIYTLYMIDTDRAIQINHLTNIGRVCLYFVQNLCEHLVINPHTLNAVFLCWFT